LIPKVPLWVIYELKIVEATMLIRQLSDRYLWRDKPVSFLMQIGRRPLAALGNSDRDLQMLQWTTAGFGPKFGLIVRHTDFERVRAYDKKSPVGKLARRSMKRSQRLDRRGYEERLENDLSL
jgi:hypothetical protein